MQRPRVVALVTGLALAGLANPIGSAAHATSSKPVTSWGYIRMDDGVRLRYTVVRPSARGRFPALLGYSPYDDGSDPIGTQVASKDPSITGQLLKAGYAIVGVNVRGTGCSSGKFDSLFTRRQALDGVAAIEWIARQQWSTGHVGMYGVSALAIGQYGPASLGAPHLDAIAPFQPAIDIYRDVAHPGGIYDAGFAALYAFVLQPEYSTRAGALALAQHDSACVSTAAAHQTDSTRARVVAQITTHGFDDELYTSRDPAQYLAGIHIPVLGCFAWQDDIVSSRTLYSYDVLKPATTWVLITNGYHGVCGAANVVPTEIRFFDRFVKGVDNGFESTPHVTVMHDAHATVLQGAQKSAGVSNPSTVAWTTSFASWPVAVRPTALHLRTGGELEPTAPTRGDGSDQYVAPAPSSANENGYLGQPNVGWKVPDAPGGSLTYTTPSLAHGVEFFGPGSADLWLSSTATDTDVQVTLSEVRPDGQEVYVQRGWLRASHRKLDDEKSTALRPYQTHRETDAAPLVPGRPTKVRVEIFPFDYVFRAGSSIRLTIDSPTSSGLWAFEPSTHPAVNTILHDAVHDSQLVLGLLPGGRALAPPQPCDTLLNQPCRPNLTPVPKGSLDLNR